MDIPSVLRVDPPGRGLHLLAARNQHRLSSAFARPNRGSLRPGRSLDPGSIVRRDEIGALAGSFDRMADRIETLLTAERRLLQDVSHELRSPLARLSFAAELVRTAPDPDQAVSRLRKEFARLSDLVGALLQMTRAEGDSDRGAKRIPAGQTRCGPG